MSNFRQKKILVLEDNNDFRTILCKFLENLGCEVIEAENSEIAVKSALLESPDLIITDLNLSEEMGIKAIYDIRQQDHLSNIPILASSSDGRLGMELFLNIENMGVGQIEYITRPFSLDALTDRIEMLLPEIKQAA